MFTVYLAGLISTEHPKSLEWRTSRAIKVWAAVNSVRLLDPLRGKGVLGEVTTDGGITCSVATSADIMRRDFRDVVSCDVLLVNLNTWGSTRPMIGTPMELGWAWEHHKPVVAVAPPKDYLWRNHPMVSQAVSHYMDTVEDAISFIERYYLTA